MGSPEPLGHLCHVLQEPDQSSLEGSLHGLQNQVVLVQEPLRADVEEGRFRRKSTCDVKERVPVRKLVWLGGRGNGGVAGEVQEEAGK